MLSIESVIGIFSLGETAKKIDSIAYYDWLEIKKKKLNAVGFE